MALSLSSIQRFPASVPANTDNITAVPTGEHGDTEGNIRPPTSPTSAEVAALPKAQPTATQNLGAPDAQGMPPTGIGNG